MGYIRSLPPPWVTPKASSPLATNVPLKKDHVVLPSGVTLQSTSIMRSVALPTVILSGLRGEGLSGRWTVNWAVVKSVAGEGGREREGGEKLFERERIKKVV